MALKVEVGKLKVDLSLLKESTCFWVTVAVLLAILPPFLLSLFEAIW